MLTREVYTGRLAAVSSLYKPFKNKIMKAKKCELWVGTSTRFFKWGDFDSISAAKRYIRDCITCYHEIRIK